MSAFLAFHFPFDATFEEVSAAVALHFGGEAVNLSTGEATPLMRDATAVFTGTAQLSVTTGANINTAEPAVEIDKNGLPWDERIHSSSKSKNADGTWRGRKGVPPQQITKVKAELLAGRQSGAVNIAPAAGNAVAPIDANTMTEDARAARIAYAKEQAFAVAGAQPCSDSVFDSLQRGQLVTVDPSVSSWFDRWQAAMHKAFTEYGQTQPVAQTAHMGMQAINPSADSNQAVQIAAAVAAPAADTFAGFAAHYAPHLANPAFAEVLATLGITGGFAALATSEAMLPAVKALLAAKGIV